jgi:redox-sensing transcriptional repressor
MNADDVPAIVIGRLPLYLRALTQLRQDGSSSITSSQLSDKLHFSPAQIRKDLSYFGEFGKQGTGYEVSHLEEQLRTILKIHRVWKMVLVGAGSLGHAIANYGGFQERGFYVAAIFDTDQSKIGETIGQLTVQPGSEMKETIRDNRIRIAILAVPAAEAQATADQLIEAGIRAILNYAPITLRVPSKIKVHDIDPAAGLQSMSYYL